MAAEKVLFMSADDASIDFENELEILTPLGREPQNRKTLFIHDGPSYDAAKPAHVFAFAGDVDSIRRLLTDALRELGE